VNAALAEMDKKVFFSTQPFAKVFFSHNYALFSRLYSQWRISFRRISASLLLQRGMYLM